ncbi:hypothetical protein JYT44_00325 [Caldithrix abyssi]|nr:hypothetical protein [Caldithrix abyssi]
MQKVLSTVSDDRVRAYIVWLPILGTDNRSWSEKRSSEFHDDRLTYFWDADRLTGESWKKMFDDLQRTAWDIYFLYGAEAQWQGQPAMPDFYMHQLGELPVELRLDRSKFELELKKLLKQASGQ